MEMQGQLTLPNCRTSTYSVRDFLARASQFQESDWDSMTREVHCFLKSFGFSSTKDPDIFYSKTLKAYLVLKAEKCSRRYLKFSPTLGIEFNGRYLIVRTSAFRNTGKECSLSDILEENPDRRYFLSEKAKQSLMKCVQSTRT